VSKDIGCCVQCPISLQTTVVDIFASQAEVAIWASLAFLRSSAGRHGASLAAVTPASGLMFPCIHHISHCSECYSVVRGRLHHRSVQALDGYRRLASTPSSVSALDAVPYEHGLLPDDFVDEYAAVRTRGRERFHSVEDLSIVIVRLMNQVRERKSMLAMMPQTTDPSRLASCQSVTHASQEAIAAMIQVRVHDLFHAT